MKATRRHAEAPVRLPAMAMGLLLCQVLFAAAIFVSLVACSLVPFMLVRGRRWTSATDADTSGVHFWKRLFGWCDCLTGGVFLAICFLSLLPNVQVQVDAILRDLGVAAITAAVDFPLAECAVLVGFFAVLVVDQVGRHCAVNRRLQCRRIIEMDSLGILDRGNDDDDDDEDDDCADGSTLDDPSAAMLVNGNRQVHFDGAADDFEVASPSTAASPLPPPPSSSSSSFLSNAATATATTTRLFRGVDKSTASSSSKEDRGLRFLIVLFGVGMHALFTGFVLGSQTDVHRAFHMFAAAAVQELVVAVTLGIAIAKVSRSAWTALRCSLIFAACVPAGIALGVATRHASSGLLLLAHCISGSTQALAAGVFLHVTFMQLLPVEYGHGGGGGGAGSGVVECEGLLNTLFIFLGFLVMATLNLTLGFVR